MADYGLFVSHLSHEDDLVTGELKEIEQLENKIKTVKKEGTEERKRIENSFRKKMREAEKSRQAVEDGSDEDIRCKTEEYEAAVTDYKANWDGRLSMLTKCAETSERMIRILKKILIYSLIACAVMGIGMAIVYSLEVMYESKYNELV